MLTYIGPNRGQGIRLFKDGALEDYDDSDWNRAFTAGDGRVIIGRRYVNRFYDYGHVEVDELIFFNKALQEDEVRELYDMYQWKRTQNWSQLFLDIIKYKYC